MPFKGLINRLRRVSFLLFLIPFTALIVTVFFHNILVTFKAESTGIKWSNLPITIKCDERNLFCSKRKVTIDLPKFTKFEDCDKLDIDYYFFIGDKKYNKSDYHKVVTSGFIRALSKKKDVKIVYFHNEKNLKCIKGSKYFKFYKIFSKPFYFLEKWQDDKRYKAGTSSAVNPFIYGEVSISNLVKRFPINYFFKPLLFITALFMFFYWFTYQQTFNKIYKSNNVYEFTIFGILSGVFLFFHVLFLGSTVDNEIFHKIRKLILILFILFEILAQYFLTRRLYLGFSDLKKFISKKVLNIKIVFVSAIVIGSIFILVILSIFNLDSKVDYILEWNYFLLLLFFYLLSFFLWKKN